MKYFLSQTMHGLSNEQIKENTINKVKIIKELDPRLEYVDTLFFPEEDDFPNEIVTDTGRRLYCLGRSISRLGECDCIVFDGSCYTTSNGCKVEAYIAKLYGIKTYFLLNNYPDNTYKLLDCENRETETPKLYIHF